MLSVTERRVKSRDASNANRDEIHSSDGSLLPADNERLVIRDASILKLKREGQTCSFCLPLRFASAASILRSSRTACSFIRCLTKVGHSSSRSRTSALLCSILRATFIRTGGEIMM